MSQQHTSQNGVPHMTLVKKLDAVIRTFREIPEFIRRRFEFKGVTREAFLAEYERRGRAGKGRMEHCLDLALTPPEKPVQHRRRRLW